MIARLLFITWIVVFNIAVMQSFAESPATSDELFEPCFDQPEVIQAPCERSSIIGGLGHWVKDVYVELIHKDWRRNNCWPKPFDCPDQYAARRPFGIMVEGGWKRQNMLGNHHFITITGQLSDAGRLKVRWIVTQVPPQYRAVYIHRALDPEETAARVNSVQQFAMQIANSGELPPIIETDSPFPGWPSGEINAILQKYRETTPTPRLPPRSYSGDGEESSSY